MFFRKGLLIKWLILIVIILVASIVAFNSRGTIGVEKDLPGKKNIVFIMKMKSGEYWDTVKMGATAAAKEFEVNVTFDGTDTEEDVDGQINLVDLAVLNKADALVLAASDYKKLKPTVEKVYDSKLPIILIDSEVNTDKFDCYIGSDNKAAGRQAGEKLVWLVGARARIIVLSFDIDNKSLIDRENGLYEVLNKHKGVEIAAVGRVNSSIEAAGLLVGQLLENNKSIDGIVALDSVGSIAAAEVLSKKKLAGKVKLIAFDGTKKEIEMLDTGVIQAMVVQNPFTIGYMGVKNAVECMNDKPIKKYNYAETKVIDATNMYLQENQKLLFPFAN